MERVQVAQPANRLTGWVDRTRHFLLGVRDEMKKVTWPTREELVKAMRREGLPVQKLQSGAVLQVIRRRVGTSLAVKPSGVLRAISDAPMLEVMITMA